MKIDLRSGARGLALSLALAFAFAFAFAAAFAPQAARAADDPATCPPAAPPLTPALVTQGMKNAHDHGFLWRISKDGRTSYLYGTIHAARFEWMFPGPTVTEALRDSDTVALELDVFDPDIQRRLAQSIGASRSDPLPPALVQRIDRRMAAECVDAAAFAKYAPEFQIASLTVLAARRDGYDPSYAIDLILSGYAHNLGKTVVSLETPEAQMEALKMPTQAETIAFVDSGLADLESGRARPLLNRLAKTWVDGDYAELARYAQWCDCLHTPADRAAMKRLLDDRNPGLAASIDALHASGKRVFAAVGSLHMIGPTGLPALLRQRGYKIEEADFAR